MRNAGVMCELASSVIEYVALCALSFLFFASCLCYKKCITTTEFHPEYYCPRGTHNVIFLLLRSFLCVFILP